MKQDCFYYLREKKGVIQYRITVAMKKQDGKRVKTSEGTEWLLLYSLICWCVLTHRVYRYCNLGIVTTFYCQFILNIFCLEIHPWTMPAVHLLPETLQCYLSLQFYLHK